MPAAGEVAASRPTRLGRYELITRIGQGGMAEVQLALQRGPAGFEKLVVVKLVHNNLASQKAFVDMLLDEARVAALVKHPNVVDIYDLGQADGRYFIAMEYLEGEPLLAVLRAGREGKRLDTLSTGRLIADTAEGLDAAHELRSMSGDRLELVHHDISLGNIVVLYNGQVKLVDFGVAKATQTTGARTKVQGKFSYMAPEKLKGAPGDRRSDIFSLGCVMWEALTLKRLFRGGNDGDTMKQVLEMAIQPPSKVNGDVPPEYDPIVMRSLERDPDRRHSTAKEMAVEIEELLRKRGYGAKNDKIARYMQDTFKDHIDARKKLVQEVVNKGSASAEVLDAAFSDPVIASGSPVDVPGPNNDFSLKYARRDTPASGVPVPTAAWADSSPKTEITTRPAHPMFDGGGTATDIAPIPDEPEKNDILKPLGKKKLPAPKSAAAVPPAVPLPPPPARPAPGATPSAAVDADMEATRLDSGPTIDPSTGASLGERARALFDKARPLFDKARDKARETTKLVVEKARPILADKKKRLYVFAGAGVFLLLIIIIAATTCGGSKPKQVAATDDHAITGGSDDTQLTGTGSDTQNTGSAPGSDTTFGAGSDTNSAKGSNIGAGSEDIEIGPPPPPPPNNGSAHETHHETGRHETGKGSNEPRHEQHEQHEQHVEPHEQHVTPPPPPPPPPPQVDAEDLVNQGLKAFVTGDTKGALALLNKAKAGKPGYAPTYRVLGKVYKKQGDKAAAKAAFQRYLKLAPNAPDAEQIRKEMEEL